MIVSSAAAIGDRLMPAFVGMTPPTEIIEWLSARPTDGFTLFRPYSDDDILAQVRKLTSTSSKQRGRATQTVCR